MCKGGIMSIYCGCEFLRYDGVALCYICDECGVCYEAKEVEDKTE